MNRILLLMSLAIFLGACNENLRTAPSKRLLPGHAFVSVKKGDLFSSTTRYDNVSATNFFRCHRDRGNKYYFEARRFFTKNDGSMEERSLSLFFPITTDTAKGVRTQWTRGDVQLLGKLPPFRSLGGVLSGSCDAELLLVENHLTGAISCRNFENTETGGLGQFDLEISNLDCIVD